MYGTSQVDSSLALILQRVTQSLIVVAILQSAKWWLAQGYFSHPHTYPLSLHLTNLVFHLGVFCLVILLVNQGRLYAAKLLLVLGFSSFITVACILWQYNVQVQYYFLFSLFVCCYVFNRYQSGHLYCFSGLQVMLYLYFQTTLPPTQYIQTLELRAFLDKLSMVNSAVFALACVVVAFFVRYLTAQSWQQIQVYKRHQSQLLSKMFPSSVMSALLDNEQDHEQANQLVRNQNTAMQVERELGVIFVDICDFTSMEVSAGIKQNNWQVVYDLFSQFDHLLQCVNAKRVKTNGDQYIVIIGFTDEEFCIQKLAQQTFAACQLLVEHTSVDIKVGAALGCVTCGVFDSSHPSFDIWGETVIRAARLENTAKPNQIRMDATIYAHIQSLQSNLVESCEMLKGLGRQKVYTQRDGSLQRCKN